MHSYVRWPRNFGLVLTDAVSTMVAKLVDFHNFHTLLTIIIFVTFGFHLWPHFSQSMPTKPEKVFVSLHSRRGKEKFN